MNKKRILFVLMGVFAFLIVVTCGSIIYKSKKEKEEFVKNVELIFSSLQSANTIDGAESFNNLGKKIKDIDADVNYHIELDDDGNIKYYLLYNDKYKIEYNGSETLNKKNVIESIKIEKTISVDELKEKQKDLNDKSLENVKYSVTSFNDLENNTSKGYKVKTENNKTVVEIFRGQQKNGCYGLEIKQVTLKNGIVEIVIKETTPSAGVSCTQAITYPAKKVTLDKKYDNITVKTESGNTYSELTTTQTPTEDTTNKEESNVKYSVTSLNDLENKPSKGYKVKTENNKTVVEIFRGQQKNGCYGLEIKQVTLKNGTVEIVIKETTPSAGVSCIQAITYPAKKVTLDKKYDNITVKTESGNTYSKLTTT
ncbi:MAG TPA: protease complex subunit PrcB family protein [Mollicutes bacterium]|nr:protease complex subunit PrcB family protein [Mollicutes bacterium]